jgi:hypothetical protein
VSLEIPDTDLMAEMLGIAILCEHCGKQIYEDEKYGSWFHSDNKTMCCSNTGEQLGPNYWTFRLVPAKPRKTKWTL